MHCKEESERLIRKYSRVGIPVEEVGKRIATLNKILEENNMAIGAEASYNVNYNYDKADKVVSVNLTVYLFENKEGEK